MLIAAALVSVGVLAGPAPAQPVGVTVRANQPQGRMYPIHRTMGYQFTKNGRRWASRPMIGPDPAPAFRSCEVPGPGAYGAPEWDHQRIPVRVGQQIITISPWQRIEMPGLHWLERERILWLKAHNYCSGVRTFRNDAYDTPPMDHHRHHGAPPPPRADAPHDTAMTEDEVVTMRGTPAPVLAPVRIEPRATIRLPDDAPRFRSRMRVMAPRINAYIASAQGQGVTTVRGEWSDGTVIKVLPIASTQVAQAKSEEPKAAPAKPATEQTEAKAAPKPEATAKKVASAEK